MFSNPKVGKNGGHFPCVKKGGDDGDLRLFVSLCVCFHGNLRVPPLISWGGWHRGGTLRFP